MSKKSKRPNVKHRDRGRMVGFDCDGWLHIFLTAEARGVAHIKYKHVDDHVPYWLVGVPEDVKQFVKDNSKLPMSKVHFYLR